MTFVALNFESHRANKESNHQPFKPCFTATASTLATLVLGSNVELGDCNSTTSQETVDTEVTSTNSCV